MLSTPDGYFQSLMVKVKQWHIAQGQVRFLSEDSLSIVSLKLLLDTISIKYFTQANYEIPLSVVLSLDTAVI